MYSLICRYMCIYIYIYCTYLKMGPKVQAPEYSRKLRCKGLTYQEFGPYVHTIKRRGAFREGSCRFPLMDRDLQMTWVVKSVEAASMLTMYDHKGPFCFIAQIAQHGELLQLPQAERVGAWSQGFEGFLAHISSAEERIWEPREGSGIFYAITWTRCTCHSFSYVSLGLSCTQ